MDICCDVMCVSIGFIKYKSSMLLMVCPTRLWKVFEFCGNIFVDTGHPGEWDEFISMLLLMLAKFCCQDHIDKKRKDKKLKTR